MHAADESLLVCMWEKNQDCLFSVPGVHVVQDLTFYVGHDQTAHLQGKPMAHVLKLSRGHSMPPTFTSANEWFNYAFSTSEIKGKTNIF